MKVSFYIQPGNRDNGDEFFTAWRSIQAPEEECGYGSTPEAAIIALLLAHPVKPKRGLSEAEIALAEIEGFLKDEFNSQGSVIALAIVENYFNNHPQ